MWFSFPQKLMDTVECPEMDLIRVAVRRLGKVRGKGDKNCVEAFRAMNRVHQEGFPPRISSPFVRIRNGYGLICPITDRYIGT